MMLQAIPRLLGALILVSWVCACGDDGGSGGSSSNTNGTQMDAGDMDTAAGDVQDSDTAMADTSTTDPPDTGDLDTMEADAELPGPFPNQPDGNPLVPEVAAYPYPSDFYLVDDPESPTGRRLEIPTPAFPSMDDTLGPYFNGVDGYSLIPLIVAYLPGGVDVTSLPSPVDHAESVADSSTVLLIEEGTWARVPLLAEIDANVPDPANAALLIRPLVALKPDTGYIVVLREGIRAPDGSPHAANEAYTALRDGIATQDPAVEAQREDFTLVAQAMDEASIAPETTLLAWSFHTRSEERLVGPLLAAQQVANDAPLGQATITEDFIQDTSNGLNRQIRGTFTAPEFADPNTGAFVWDPDTGEIMVFGEREVPFVMTIPVAIDEPRPVIMYGHGFLGTSIQATRGRFNRFCHENRFSVAATEFGFHEGVVAPLANALGGDPRSFDIVTTEVIQAFANTTHLTRIVQTQLAQELTVEDSEEISPIDPTATHYLGISNGGTFGYVHAATSPQVQRAVMLVGGGGLIHFLERAVQWADFQFIFDTLFPDPLELQLFFSIIQQQLDLVDSMSFARRMVENRYPDLPPLQAQVHMAVHDSQVRNLVTEWVVRSANVPMVVPSAKDVYGLTPLDLNMDNPPEINSAFYIYDEMPEPSPITNVPPAEDNDVHGTVRDLMSYRTHAGSFLEDGSFLMECDGPCDPE